MVVECAGDQVECGGEVVLYHGGGNAEYADSFGFQNLLACAVAGYQIRCPVNVAVYFNCQACRVTVEVQHERTEWTLPPPLRAE